MPNAMAIQTRCFKQGARAANGDLTCLLELLHQTRSLSKYRRYERLLQVYADNLLDLGDEPAVCTRIQT